MQNARQLEEASTTLKTTLVERVRQGKRWTRVHMHPVEQREYHFLCSKTEELVRRFVDGLAEEMSGEQMEEGRLLQIVRENLSTIPCYVVDDQQAPLRAHYYSTLRQGDSERIRAAAKSEGAYQLNS